jgi:hypothetical protein
VVEAFDDRFDLVADEVVERVQLMVCMRKIDWNPLVYAYGTLQAPTSLQHQNVDTSS